MAIAVRAVMPSPPAAAAHRPERRDTATKQALYRAITDNLVENMGLRPKDVLIVLSPNERDDWCFGNGIASYVADRAT